MNVLLYIDKIAEYLRHRAISNSQKLIKGSCGIHKINCAVCNSPIYTIDFYETDVCGNCINNSDYG